MGGTSQLLVLLVDALRRHVLSATKLHADDTPIPVLAPGNGKTKTGRLWTYVRDDRPAGDATPAAVWFAYSPDRKGEHPRSHLSHFTGTLQADDYAGFDGVYKTGRIQEAACWAQVRRKFYDLHLAHRSPVAAEAMERIAALYATRPSVPCGPSHRAEKTTSSPAPMPAVSVPDRQRQTQRPRSRAYLRNVLSRIASHPINRIEQLLPWNSLTNPAEFPFMPANNLRPLSTRPLSAFNYPQV